MRQILSGLLNKYVRSTAGLFWQKRREIKKEASKNSEWKTATLVGSSTVRSGYHVTSSCCGWVDGMGWDGMGWMRCYQAGSSGIHTVSMASRHGQHCTTRGRATTSLLAFEFFHFQNWHPSLPGSSVALHFILQCLPIIATSTEYSYCDGVLVVGCKRESESNSTDTDSEVMVSQKSDQSSRSRNGMYCFGTGASHKDTS